MLTDSYAYPSYAECAAAGVHLTDCDADGYCNHCGHQDGTLNASFVYSGYRDYWGGYTEENREDYSEHLLCVSYGRDTSLRYIIEELVEDSYNGLPGVRLPKDVTEDDVRKALLDDMLDDQGRADYESGALAKCSADWMANIPDDDDDYDSPIFVAVLRYKKSG